MAIGSLLVDAPTITKPDVSWIGQLYDNFQKGKSDALDAKSAAALAAAVPNDDGSASSPTAQPGILSNFAKMLGIGAPAAPTAPVAPTAKVAAVAPLTAPSPGEVTSAPLSAAPASIGNKSLPRGLRNSNPGNIKDGAFAQHLPGYAGSDGTFARFDTLDNGLSAMSTLLGRYGKTGLSTPAQIVGRWAPAGADNNPTASYAANVAKQLGIGVNDPIDMNDPNARLKLASAMASFENGRPVNFGGSRAPVQVASADPGFAPDLAGGPAPQPNGGAPLPAAAFNDRFQGDRGPGLTNVTQPAASQQVAQGATPPASMPPAAASIPPGSQPIEPAGIPWSAIRTLVSNPNTQQLGMALWQQKSQPKANGIDFLETPDGTIVRTNKLTGEVTPIYKGETKPPNPTADMQDFAYAQSHPEFQKYQTDLKTAGRAQTSVNVDMKGEGSFQSTLGADQAKMYQGMVADGIDAKSDLSRIQNLRGQMASLPGGFIGGAQAIANGWGIKLGPNASNVEAANAILSQLVPAQRQGLPGAASDRDVSMFRAALPQLSNTPQGNEMIMNSMESMAKYRMAQAQIAGQVSTGQISRQDGIAALQGLPDPLAEFKASLGAGAPGAPPAAGTNGATPQQPGTPPISGAQQAPDGLWYVPDPNRQGKWLKVVP